MNHLLQPRIWPFFLASSGIGICDEPFRYASGPIPRYRGTSCQVARPSSSRSLRSVPQAGFQFRGLTTAIHEISGLACLKIED
ncbi:MAG: hypothetical protein P8X67_08520 [Syntrophobacterales bacterium]